MSVLNRPCNEFIMPTTLGILWAHSMQSPDVNTVTQFADTISRCNHNQIECSTEALIVKCDHWTDDSNQTKVFHGISHYLLVVVNTKVLYLY